VVTSRVHGAAGVALVSMAIGGAPAVAQPGTTERVSVDSAEGQAEVFVTPGGETPGSFSPAISNDGLLVAFDSNAADLVPGDTNGVGDVFVRDRAAGTTERVSVSSGEVQANGGSGLGDISGDGRFIAFASLATNLIPGDSNRAGDVFVRDRLAGTTERVSLDPGGGQFTAESFDPAITADGRFVAFSASGFIFARDREAGTTELVSIDTAGNRVEGFSPAISGDGRFVAFGSSGRLFLRDRLAGTTELVEVTDPFTAFGPALDADGSVVAFTTGGADVNSVTVAVRDRDAGVTERIAPGFTGAVSADGRFVAFTEPALGGAQDVFVHDRVTDRTEQISVNSAGEVANNGSFTPDISADGRFVAFESAASNLVPGDTNGALDIFVRDRGPATSARGELVALRVRITDFGLPRGLQNSFTAKVDSAIRGLDRRDIAATCGSLRALANHARAQAAKKLTEAQAAQLTAGSGAIATRLGCT